MTMKTIAASVLIVLLALSGTARAQGGISRNSWTQIGPPGAGTVNGLAIDSTNPSRMFLASPGGGIWKSVDEGNTWAPVDDYLASMAVTAIVYHPRNPQIMYAATGSSSRPGVGVLRSLDGGQTWGLLPQTAGLDFSVINNVVLSPDGGVMLAVTPSGLLRTADGGATWTKVVSGRVTGAAFLPSGSAVAAGTESSGICRMLYSNTAGFIWTPASGTTNGGVFGTLPGSCLIGASTTSSSVVYLTQGISFVGRGGVPIGSATFTYVYNVSPGSTPGNVTFFGRPSAPADAFPSSAASDSVIVTPPLPRGSPPAPPAFAGTPRPG